MVTWGSGWSGELHMVRRAGPARSLPSPGSPHWASSEQPLQSHTKLHMASLGGLQWLGTQAQPGDPAATRETARCPGATFSPILLGLGLSQFSETPQTRAAQDTGCPALGPRPRGSWLHVILWGCEHAWDTGPPKWNTPWGRKQEPSREPEALPGGCPPRGASMGAPGPSGSIWSKSTDLSPGPSHLVGQCPVPKGLSWVPPCTRVPQSALLHQDLMTHPGAGPGWAGGGWAEAWSKQKEQGEGLCPHQATWWGLCWVISLRPQADSALMGVWPPGGPSPC